MFDFINRAASTKEPAIEQGVDELIPYGDWRAKLERPESQLATADDRKRILVDAFGESPATIGSGRARRRLRYRTHGLGG